MSECGYTSVTKNCVVSISSLGLSFILLRAGLSPLQEQNELQRICFLLEVLQSLETDQTSKNAMHS